MGRGRAKAKQTKVARELKYSTTGTDLERLQAELRGGGSPSPAVEADSDGDELDDDYAGYAAYDDEDDEDAAAR